MARLRSLGQELLQGLVALLFPGVCYGCGGRLISQDRDFCAACRGALTTDPYPVCPRCASTVGPHVFLQDGCSECRPYSLHFAGALRLGPYVGLLRELIPRMKYLTGDGLAEALGLLWARHAEASFRGLAVDAVVPVPLHWRRRLWRGYNQSEAVARALADQLRLPCRPGWLRRVRNTPRQVGQSASARRENPRGAFQAPPLPELKGKVILLVDDVITTGSTVNDAARALRAAGATRIHVAVLAHSQR
jgi:ComF family protein